MLSAAENEQPTVAETATPAEPAPPPDRPLHEIIASILDGDAVLERTGNVAPTTEADMIALRKKIAGYRYKICEWEREASRFDGEVAYLEKELKAVKAKRGALLNKAEDKRKRIIFMAQLLSVGQLPGDDCIAVLVRASNPKAPVIHRDVTPEDMKKFPGLVEQIPRSYEWDTAAIKDTLKLIAKKEEAGEALTEFEAKVKTIAHLEYSYSVEFEPRGEVAE